jgi:hypothetical protein
LCRQRWRDEVSWMWFYSSWSPFDRWWPVISTAGRFLPRTNVAFADEEAPVGNNEIAKLNGTLSKNLNHFC